MSRITVILLLVLVTGLCLPSVAHSFALGSKPNQGIPCPPKPPHLISLKQDSVLRKDLTSLLKQCYQRKINQLNDYISIMSDRTQPLDTRNYYKDIALGLFIANGDSYVEDSVLNTGAKIVVASGYKKNPVSRLLKDYFTGLVNLRYPKVNILPINVDEIEIIDYKMVDDSNYEVTAYYSQSFAGMRDGKPMFRDVTRKKCKIHILIESTCDGPHAIVLLGDINAIEIHKDR